MSNTHLKVMLSWKQNSPELSMSRSAESYLLFFDFQWGTFNGVAQVVKNKATYSVMYLSQELHERLN